MSFKRRQFLGGAALLPALQGVAFARGREPKNVIFMVADGMSPSVIPLAEAFSQAVRGRGTVWAHLLRRNDVVRGMFDMASLNSLVTDSSAASSSWGSGARIYNGSVNVLPDGTRLTPIGWLAKDQGRRVGLVTTATVTHATPAGFGAVQAHRDDEARIAQQYLDKVDIVLGGGRKFFDPASLPARYQQQGYQLVTTRQELRAAKGDKVLGLFAPSHMPYSIDHARNNEWKESTPTLAEMAECALAKLDRASKGFLLQIEGARVDHAAHANDAAALLWDQLAFDDAIAAVLQYVARRPDTLLVIGSDHGNANPGLMGMGDEYEASTQCFRRLERFRMSYAEASKLLGFTIEYTGTKPLVIPPTVLKGDQVRAHVLDQFGIELTPNDVSAVVSVCRRDGRGSLSRQLDNPAGVLSQILGNSTGVCWTGTTHSSDYVLTLSLGPGSQQFAGLVRNTEVFAKLTRLMGIQFKNPSMTLERAQQVAGAFLHRRQRPDWA